MNCESLEQIVKKSRIRYQIMDSHRRMKKSKKEAIAEFFCDVKEVSLEKGYEQVEFCQWFEHEFAVSWFEVVVYDGKLVIGYLRCLRNPEKLEEWFIGDVHVRKNYRGHGVASKMYQMAIDEVKKYEAAEDIVTSVSRGNINSIGLHLKMGFFNTEKECDFPHFYFPEDETAYKRWLYRYYPIQDRKMALEMIWPLWIQYESENGIKNEEEMQENLYTQFQRYENTEQDFEMLWCGNRLVGFAYSEVEFCIQNN